VTRVYRPGLPGDAGDLNLSWTKDDDPALVAENRRRFVAAVVGKRAATGTTLVTLRQIHSGVVHVLRDRKQAVATEDGRAVLRGDGMMTNLPGLLLGIQTADCIPVLVADRKRRAVAGFHAGWRGTVARIVERGIGLMRLEYGSRPQDLVAAIGPGVGPCCYAVGEEVVQQFISQFVYFSELFSEVYDADPVREKYPQLFLTARAPGHSNLGPQTHLDLWEANRRQLLDAGLPAKNITVMAECTACKPVRYFSHRGEHGFTGRMLNAIGVAERTNPRAKAVFQLV
jgi:YfiH family protein